MKSKNTHIGKYGEQLVAQKLQNQGFSILAHNYRKHFGEIDVIASKKDLIIFVEVKTRQHKYSDLTEVIVPSKQKKIIAAAQAFLLEQGILDKVCRFDVALLEYIHDKFEMQYIENAFVQEDGCW